MARRALACGVLLGLAACGGGSRGPKQSSDDRLLLLVWNYPDTGVTRLLVELHDDAAVTASMMLAPESDEVEATAILQSPAHTVHLDGSYYHDGDYFRLAHRSGSDSIIMFGEYEPHPLRSPIITTMTFSGPPAGDGNAYGVRDTTGAAMFFCARYALTDTGVSHSFGLIVTDSLVIGLGGALPLPFAGVAQDDSLILADGALRGRLSGDRSTVAGTITLLGHTGQWSGRRCEVTGG
jgi:hypothetical protein